MNQTRIPPFERRLAFVVPTRSNSFFCLTLAESRGSKLKGGPWWATCVRLRTWLFETTDFYLPDLTLKTEHESSVTEKREVA